MSYEDTDGTILFHGLQSAAQARQLLPASGAAAASRSSGRGGLQPQSRRADSASAFPTLRSGNQFDMPNNSEDEKRLDERRDGRRSRTKSPPAAHGGARRSESQIESFGQLHQGKFLTADVPDALVIKTYWVYSSSREDWPGFVWQLINMLALSHVIVLINAASQETQANFEPHRGGSRRHRHPPRAAMDGTLWR